MKAVACPRRKRAFAAHTPPARHILGLNSKKNQVLPQIKGGIPIFHVSAPPPSIEIFCARCRMQSPASRWIVPFPSSQLICLRYEFAYFRI